MTTTNAPLDSYNATAATRSLRFWMILVSLIMAFFLAQTGYAQLPAVNVSAPSVKQAMPSKFTVPITASDLTNRGIIAFQFNVIYDPAVINPSGLNFGCSTDGTLSGQAGMVATCNVTPAGTLRVAVYGAYPMTGSGPVLNLKFATARTAIPGSSSTLNFENLYFFNESGYVATVGHNGRITLTLAITGTRNALSPEGGAPVTAEKPGSGFVVPINAAVPADSEITALQFDVIYDPNVMVPSGPNYGCSTEGTIGEAFGTYAICSVVPEGVLRVTVFSPYPLHNSGTVLNLNFTTTENATSDGSPSVNLENVYFFGAIRGKGANLYSGPATFTKE